MSTEKSKKTDKKLDKLEQHLLALEEKNTELTADLQRIQADFMNFRRRSEEERMEIMNLAKRDVIIQLLPLLDNIDRALAHLPADLEGNDWAKGVAAVAKHGQDLLKTLGIERLKSEGEPFDPSLHEAISFEDGEGDKELVVEELQPGYRLGSRLLRPAIVKVGKK